MAKANLRKIVAKNVKRIRLKRKMTQEVAAEMAGFHYKYYQRIESGEINLTLDSVERISRAFKVRVQELIV